MNIKDRLSELEQMGVSRQSIANHSGLSRATIALFCEGRSYGIGESAIVKITAFLQSGVVPDTYRDLKIAIKGTYSCGGSADLIAKYSEISKTEILRIHRLGDEYTGNLSTSARRSVLTACKMAREEAKVTKPVYRGGVPKGGAIRTYKPAKQPIIPAPGELEYDRGQDPATAQEKIDRIVERTLNSGI